MSRNVSSFLLFDLTTFVAISYHPLTLSPPLPPNLSDLDEQFVDNVKGNFSHYTRRRQWKSFLIPYSLDTGRRTDRYFGRFKTPRKRFKTDPTLKRMDEQPWREVLDKNEKFLSKKNYLSNEISHSK